MRYTLFHELGIDNSKLGFELTLHVQNDDAPDHLFDGIFIRFVVLYLKFGVNTYSA